MSPPDNPLCAQVHLARRLSSTLVNEFLLGGVWAGKEMMHLSSSFAFAIVSGQSAGVLLPLIRETLASLPEQH